jgi:beta-aspartyl-peptidase (threonine type)
VRTSPLGIVCHGGAGTLVDKQAHSDGLAVALEEGYRLLRQSGRALDAVVKAVTILEDNPVFNCGTGSNLALDGSAEMDAAVMTQEGRFGGVCCITDVKNPILVAEKVLTDTDHALLCGGGATALARQMGFEKYDVKTERSYKRLETLKAEGKSDYFPRLGGQIKMGTAGAVAIDKHGSLAVATSSGGITGRMPGRVSDTAIPGAGTYAAPSGAVSCCGHGEAIIQLMLAHDTVERMKTMPASVAATLAVSEAKRRKFMVGLVGIDARGGVCFGHSTPDMSYGYMIANRLFMFAEGKGK